MAIPTNAKQPSFLYATAAADGQYVAVAAAAANVTLQRGVYVLTSVDVAIQYALDVNGSLGAANGHHLPASDTRVLIVDSASNFTFRLAPGGATPGSLNISKVQPSPERF